jgi:hypothetical protein
MIVVVLWISLSSIGDNTLDILTGKNGIIRVAALI